jgi:DNA-binding MarR family transcriptional regulator
MVKQPHDQPARGRQADFVEALDLLLELSVLLADDMARDLERRGLTRSRTHVVWLVHHRGPMTQRALADATGVSARNVTGLVDALVDTGFVTREPHPSDRRATLITLTKRGRSTADELVREQAALARALFAGLEEPGFDHFRAGLDHVVGVLRRLVDEAS